MSETWLRPDIPDCLIAIDNYFLVRNDRLLCRGDGVACYIDKSLTVKVLAASNNENIEAPEYLILDICLPNADRLLFASVYRRPKGQLFF